VGTPPGVRAQRGRSHPSWIGAGFIGEARPGVLTFGRLLRAAEPKEHSRERVA